MIRNAQPSDWPFIRELCCRTGKSGDPIEEGRWPFFGEQWVGPYERLVPEWTYVATLGGKRMGYLTGCKDTAAFEIKKLLWFDLLLLTRIFLLREFPMNAETRRFMTRTLRLEQGPNDRFRPEVLQRIRDEYPAHLHMNVEAVARGTGLGRELVTQYQSDLLKQGVRGIHLFCGARPVPFYQKVGFQVLDVLEFRPGVNVYAMGVRF